MCLTVLIQKHRKPYKGEGEGWKSFDEKDGKLYFIFYPLKGAVYNFPPTMRQMQVPRGRWLKSAESSVIMDGGALYRAGFHVYTEASRQQMERPAPGIVKVKYRGVKAIGEQNGFKVVVADEIFVPRRKK